MAGAPVLYALRDLTLATKANACQAARDLEDTADWALLLNMESAVAGDLQREYELWELLLEPWLDLDLRHQRPALKLDRNPALPRYRRCLADSLGDRRSFVALAFPALLAETVRVGFRTCLVAPIPSQIEAFTPSEQAHHQACAHLWKSWLASPDSDRWQEMAFLSDKRLSQVRWQAQSPGVLPT